MGVSFSHAPPSGNEPQDGDVRVEGSCAKRAVAGVSRVQHQRVHQELKDVDVPVLGGPAKRVVAVIAGVGHVQPKCFHLELQGGDVFLIAGPTKLIFFLPASVAVTLRASAKNRLAFTSLFKSSHERPNPKSPKSASFNCASPHST